MVKGPPWLLNLGRERDAGRCGELSATEPEGGGHLCLRAGSDTGLGKGGGRTEPDVPQAERPRPRWLGPAPAGRRRGERNDGLAEAPNKTIFDARPDRMVAEEMRSGSVVALSVAPSCKSSVLAERS
jgi:hypothetical protein